MAKVLIMDPAGPRRDGEYEMYGDSDSALNGSISRIFLTDVPQSVPTADCRQPDGWTCGPYAMAECLGMSSGEEARNWLLQRGWIDSESGTWYSGIVGYINVKGYDCAYDGRAHDGERTGAALEGVLNHLRSGKKVILCMHGIKKGGRTDYWTKSGHYICLYGIKDDKLTVDGYWGPTTTAFAQRVFKVETDGFVSNQNKGMFGYLFPYCQEESWEFVDETQVFNGSALIRAIQNMLGVNVDGQFGPNTLKALQKFLKVKVDGNFGPKTGKAWQKWLNTQV